MVKQETTNAKHIIKVSRRFSPEVKREVVRKIERNELGVTQASREYEVSQSAIYKWMYHYSIHLKKGNILIVEKKSRTEQMEAYKRRIAELERIVGQKQLEIDILNKTLEIGSAEAGYDIKKTHSGKSSNSTGAIKTNTGTK